jgi:hypothetical protein
MNAVEIIIVNRNSTHSPRRAFGPAGALTLMFSLALGSAGCGTSRPASDRGDATQALHSALDAWKRGEKPEGLAQKSPPIHATDGDWLAGLKLQNYQADDNGSVVGSDVHFKVVLEVKTDKGRVVKKNATYSVTTGAQLLVKREDSL